MPVYQSCTVKRLGHLNACSTHVTEQEKPTHQRSTKQCTCRNIQRASTLNPLTHMHGNPHYPSVGKHRTEMEIEILHVAWSSAGQKDVMYTHKGAMIIKLVAHWVCQHHNTLFCFGFGEKDKEFISYSASFHVWCISSINHHAFSPLADILAACETACIAHENP